MGPNNCLMLSLRDLLIPDPPQLRSMLSQLYWDMDPGRKVEMARAILAHVPVDTLEMLDLDELTARCTDHVLNDGHLPAELLIVFLESAARNHTLDRIMSARSDIAFFADAADLSGAKLVTSFQYPTDSPSGVAMIMCSADSSHFDRLRPARAPSAVLTSAWDLVPLVAKRPQRRPHATRASPAAVKKLIPSLHAVPEEPASSSRFESKNRFAELASDDPDSAVVSVTDLNHAPPITPTRSLATSCARQHLDRKPRGSPSHPGCYLPTGPSPVANPLAPAPLQHRRAACAE